MKKPRSSKTLALDNWVKVTFDITYHRLPSQPRWRVLLAQQHPMSPEDQAFTHKTIQDVRFGYASDDQRLTIVRNLIGQLSANNSARRLSTNNNVASRNDNSNRQLGHVREDFTVFEAITDPEKIHIRAKYDTGADDNFITRDAIKRAGLGRYVQEVHYSEDATFYMLNNEEFVPKHRLRITWWKQFRPKKKYSESFYVVPEAPYDMILGLGFILLEKVFVPKQYVRKALPLRRKPRPDGVSKITQIRDGLLTFMQDKKL